MNKESIPTLHTQLDKLHTLASTYHLQVDYLTKDGRQIQLLFIFGNLVISSR